MCLRTYWTQFAKTGNPNTLGFPEWSAYNVKSEQALQLGRTTRLHPIQPRILNLARIMREVLTDATIPASDSKSNPSEQP